MKAHNNNSGWLFGELLGHCLGELSGSRWRSLHQVLAPHFSQFESQKCTPWIHSYVRRWTQELRLHGDGDAATYSMAPAKEMRSLMLHIIVEALYGHVGTDLFEELEVIGQRREGLLLVAFTETVYKSSWSRFLPTGTIADLRRFQKQWEQWNRKVLHESQESTPARSLWQAALDGSIDDRERLQTLDEMLFANIDVSLAAAAWCIVAIAKYEEVQQGLFAEVRQMKRVGKWDSYVASSSTLLAATVTESGRLFPLAAFSVPQSAPTPRTVGGGYVVPKGTDFIVDTRTSNLSPYIWGEDSHCFRPSRWLNMSSTERRETRYQGWRYGFGPRQCLGKHLAEVMLRTIVAALVDAFELKLIKPDESDVLSARDPSCWINTPTAEVTCSTRTET